MNGGAGLRFDARVPTESTTGLAAAQRGRVALRGLAVTDVQRLAVDPDDVRGELGAVRRSASSASSVQYSRAVKARISRSRSTTIRTATDWTRPADRPPRTLLDSSGLSV